MLSSLFKIGLACSVKSPKERINMVDVTRELSKIRKAFLPGKINGNDLIIHILIKNKCRCVTLFLFPNRWTAEVVGFVEKIIKK